jgi:glycosyltransferase involved in cell wall biosynthesis
VRAAAAVYAAETELARALRDVHVTVFPNRAESGTNLFATQALAAGVPSVLSDNTGHGDLLALRMPLTWAVPSYRNARDPAGWGESRVDEVVAALTQVYTAYQQGTVDAGESTAVAVHRVFSWQACYENITRATQARG